MTAPTNKRRPPPGLSAEDLELWRRVTQGDVRLLDVPCPGCGHSPMGHDYDAICWTGDCQCEMSRSEVIQRNHERIVATRVGEVAERASESDAVVPPPPETALISTG